MARTGRYEIDMCSGKLLPKILTFALPLMCSSVLQLLFNAADIVVVGKFAGDNSLAAVGSNAALINLMVNLFVGLSVGANILAARYTGAGNREGLRQTVHTSMLLAFLSGLLLAAVGLCNLFFDRAPVLDLGLVVLSGGWVSLLTLLIKGMFSFLAVYLLIATTGIEAVCTALRQLHVPRVLVTTILLTYRYIVLLLQEANRISTAYALRAPGQKGIHFRAWGSLLGQLLLRSMDRAQLVYESMLLRGYHCGSNASAPNTHARTGGVLFAAVTVVYCLVFRCIPVFELIGNLF